MYFPSINFYSKIMNTRGCIQLFLLAASFLSSFSFLVPLKTLNRISRSPPYLTAKVPSSSSNDDDDDRETETPGTNTEDYVDVDAVTDAEALLACRAYLQRKNRLGSWKDYQRRKEFLRQASAIGRTQAPESVGYFWENTEELVYLDRHEDNEDEDDEQDKLLQEEEHGIIYESIEEQDGGDTIILGTTLSALERGAEFTSLPTSPSQERINRSNAAKKTWSDPEWKAMWYEKRWGRLRNTTPSASKQKRLDERIRNMPPKLFESQELASLTQDEIEEAIRTYVVSNRKRSRAHTTDAKIEKKRQAQQEEKRRRDGKGETAKIDLMFGSDEALKEAQRKRSERAAKAYQTRLANQNRNRPSLKRSTESKPTTPPSTTTTVLPDGHTPKDALVRVQAALESNELPTIADIKLILEPAKLGRRKDLLRRILNEHFDLRGKCIPLDPGEDSSEMLFVTQCSIDQLGSFVIEKMQDGYIADESVTVTECEGSSSSSDDG